MTELPIFTAHDGFSLPAIGFGTVGLTGDNGVAVISTAIAAGYRLIDTAVNYENEGTVGKAIAQSGLERSQIIVTSKLPGRYHEAPGNLASIEESRSRLGLDAIDLHLIHWPNPIEGHYEEAWKGLIAARDRAVVKHIGVSNFLPEHLEKIEKATGERPVVNQIEVHPYFPQEEAIQFHREQGIITEAWSPLGQARDVLSEPVVTEIAKAHDATEAQIILAWHIARGVVSIPRSTSAEHQAANLAAATIALDPAEVEAITGLGRPDGRLFDGDPAVHEEL